MEIKRWLLMCAREVGKAPPADSALHLPSTVPHASTFVWHWDVELEPQHPDPTGRIQLRIPCINSVPIGRSTYLQNEPLTGPQALRMPHLPCQGRNAMLLRRHGHFVTATGRNFQRPYEAPGRQTDRH